MCLNSFHKYIQLTYEFENKDKMPLLDVSLILIGTKIDTTPHRKGTVFDIYLIWGSFALVNWKGGTLKRCSTESIYSFPQIILRRNWTI